VSSLRILALSLGAGVIAFFIAAIKPDDRPFCAGIGPRPDTCRFGPVPVEWYLNALPVGIAVFLIVLVGLWAVRRRRHQEEGNT
jgi:uncharacterized protein (TIGR03382 family)